MEPISSVSTIGKTSSSSITSSAANEQGSFASIMQQIQQYQPDSAYIPKAGPYSVEACGSHIVNGVQLVPGAPGYRQDLAAPWLEQIAASYATRAAFQDGPATYALMPAVEETSTDVFASAKQAANTSGAAESIGTADTVTPPVTAGTEMSTTSNAASVVKGTAESRAGDQTNLDALAQSKNSQANKLANVMYANVEMLLDQMESGNDSASTKG